MPQFMKALVFAFLVSIAPANMLIAQASSETPKFTLILSADNPEVTLGSDIGIGIKNNEHLGGYPHSGIWRMERCGIRLSVRGARRAGSDGGQSRAASFSRKIWTRHT